MTDYRDNMIIGPTAEQMTDLVKRARRALSEANEIEDVLVELIAEIERLRADNERLRDAIREYFDRMAAEGPRS